MAAATQELVSIRFESVATRNGARQVLVATPQSRRAVDLERLLAMEAGTFHSRLNDELIAGLSLLGPSTRPQAVVFRAATEGGRALGFDPSFTDQEVVRFGAAVVRAQLALFRQIAVLGVQIIVGVEFLPRELEAYERGAARLTQELERDLQDGDADTQANARTNLWLLDHFALWNGLSERDYLASRLSDDLDLAHRKRRQLEQLLGL